MWLFSKNHTLFFAFFLILITALVVTVLAQSAYATDRLKLWEIKDQCLLNQQTNQNPAPCIEVNVTNGTETGYVVLQDKNGIAQFLLIPTRRITGIESPLILEPDTPNYWLAAWNARTYVFNKLQKVLPWDTIGLALNSRTSRSQDQFHVHIDCLSPRVIRQLREHREDIGTTWSKMGFDLEGRQYRAKRVVTLSGVFPFRSLIDDLGIKPSDMGLETLVIAGNVFENHNGFVLLEDSADPKTGVSGHGEDLLDPSCAIATSN
jgi:CDP-diacylglycerol pyrophosphatase